MNNRSQQTGGRRYWKSNKIFLVELRSTFLQNSRTCSLQVKPCKSERPTHQVHEQQKNADGVFGTALGKYGSKRPAKNQSNRRNAEREYVCKRIELNSDLGRGSGHSGDTAI